MKRTESPLFWLSIIAYKLDKQIFSQSRLSYSGWKKGYPNCISSVYYHVAFFHTSFWSSETLLIRELHIINQVGTFSVHIPSSTDLSNIFYTSDSYKHWKPTACPCCCQSVSPACISLLASNINILHSHNIILFLSTQCQPDAGNPRWCLSYLSGVAKLLIRAIWRPTLTCAGKMWLSVIALVTSLYISKLDVKCEARILHVFSVPLQLMLRNSSNEQIVKRYSSVIDFSQHKGRLYC